MFSVPAILDASPCLPLKHAGCRHMTSSAAAVVPHDWLHAHGELEVQVDAFPSSLALEFRRGDGKIQAVSPQTMAQHWRSKMANDRRS
jgi:hypothetical protein